MAMRKLLYSGAYAVVSMLLRLTSIIADVRFHTKKYGSRADDVMLFCAVFMAQIEGRPMTATKLAHYVGMPRPTVVRKLREMEREGVIAISDSGHATVTDPQDLNVHLAALSSEARLIHQASAKLSKMDL